MDTHDPLKEVSESIQGCLLKGDSVAAVFDLDSTLFSVHTRTARILEALASNKSFSSRFETEVEHLKTLEIRPTDWGIREALLRHYPQGSMEFFKAIRDHWRKHFFSSGYLDHDQIYPFASEYVRHLAELGAEIFYLTGRSRSAMEEGTLRVLKAHNFPLKSFEHLHMKPSDLETDEHYKALVLRELIKSKNHIWFFENEPVIIEQVRKATPTVHIVFIDSTHSGRATPPEDLPRIGMSYDGRWRVSQD